MACKGVFEAFARFFCTCLPVRTGWEDFPSGRCGCLGKTWEKIADEMYMSDRNVYILRKKAMDKLADKYLKRLYDTEKRASGE